MSYGAAGELWREATHLQEGLAWLESREGSELTDSPGLWERYPQTQPSARVLGSSQGSSGPPHSKVPF